MTGAGVTPWELLGLILVGGAPAFVCALGYQFYYGRRRVVLSWTLIALLAGLTLLIALPVTLLAWAALGALPSSILGRLPTPASDLEMLWIIAAIPSVIGAAAGVVGAQWVVTKLRRLAPA